MFNLVKFRKDNSKEMDHVKNHRETLLQHNCLLLSCSYFLPNILLPLLARFALSTMHLVLMIMPRSLRSCCFYLYYPSSIPLLCNFFFIPFPFKFSLITFLMWFFLLIISVSLSMDQVSMCVDYASNVVSMIRSGVRVSLLLRSAVEETSYHVDEIDKAMADNS